MIYEYQQNKTKLLKDEREREREEDRKRQHADLQVDIALVVIKLLCARELAAYILHHWLGGRQVTTSTHGHLDH